MNPGSLNGWRWLLGKERRTYPVPGQQIMSGCWHFVPPRTLRVIQFDERGPVTVHQILAVCGSILEGAGAVTGCAMEAFWCPTELETENGA
jgi:hypothetical protein